jgi:DeoR/GlpR family transcriptional regulator of sugar metabolism
VIYPRLGVLVGPLAVAAFAQVHADFAIMSCGGITPDGITNSHGLLIEIQRAMMQAAQRVILCVDHTKFGRQSISQLCGLDAIDTLITDWAPSPEMEAALRDAGVELIVASPEGAKVIVATRPQPPRPRPRPRLRKVVVEPTAPTEENDAFID